MKENTTSTSRGGALELGLSRKDGLVGEGLELVTVTHVELALELDPVIQMTFEYQRGRENEGLVSYQWRRRA